MENIKKFNKPLCSVLIILACVIFFGSFINKPASANTKTDTTISWGIKHNGNEKTPTPPAGSVELLKAYDGFFVGDTNSKKVYFTFDLGYEAGYTGEVLDILKQNNIKAVFFLCGNYLKEDALIKRMIDEGHFIGNHTDKHKDLPTLSEQEINKDITDLSKSFKAKFECAPDLKFFRPPQGRFNKTVLELAKSENLSTVLWSIAIVDWNKSPIDATACSNKIADRIHPGAIILLHISNSGTPKMLSQLLPKISEKGYEIGSPLELLNNK